MLGGFRYEARAIRKVIPATLSILMGTVILLACVKGNTRETESTKPKSMASCEYTFNLKAGGLERYYVVYVPESYDGKTPMPVVIMFHGGGGTAHEATRGTGWTEKADIEGFLAVFPEGTRENPSKPARFAGNPQTWNDGSQRGIGAVERNVDDVMFVRQMIHDVCLRFTVDTHRIYATGFSNGASMTFRIGRELSGSLAAIAPVAGSDWSQSTKIDRPISVLYITGAADPLNPIEGGEICIGRKQFGNKPPVHDMIQKWVQLLDCPTNSRVVRQDAEVKGIAYGPGKDGSEVVFYTVERMGHTWPGGRTLLPEHLVGRSSDKLKATDVIWEFFQKHPMK
jgi:polyhydroxybutyrate depolymerase